MSWRRGLTFDQGRAVLQFLPLIMSLLDSKKKDEQASSQNSAAAMLGQAPTAQGGEGLDGAMGSALGGLQDKASERQRANMGMPQEYEKSFPRGSQTPSKGTNDMLDEGLGKVDPDLDDDDLLKM